MVKDKLNTFFSIFIPKDGYFITPIIINLNIVAFVTMIATGVNALLPDNMSLIQWGANYKPITLDGQWWRILTSIFLHIGFLHLLMNMYALVYIGKLLEPYLGKLRTLSAYILTGILASLTSLWWHDYTVSAGASGAIFGLYGVFLSLLTTQIVEPEKRKTVLTSILVFVGYNLVGGLKAGIDNAAHVGGLLSGIVIGYCFVSSLRDAENPNLNLTTNILLSVFVTGSAFFAIKKIPNDLKTYNTKIQEFAPMESQAMELYNMSRGLPKEYILSEIRDRSLYYWNGCSKLITDLDKLSLPEQLHQRDQKLLDYCSLRIETCHLIYKAVDQGEGAYQDEIKANLKKIEEILKELKGESEQEGVEEEGNPK